MIILCVYVRVAHTKVTYMPFDQRVVVVVMVVVVVLHLQVNFDIHYFKNNCCKVQNTVKVKSRFRILLQQSMLHFSRSID